MTITVPILDIMQKKLSCLVDNPIDTEKTKGLHNLRPRLYQQKANGFLTLPHQITIFFLELHFQ